MQNGHCATSVHNPLTKIMALRQYTRIDKYIFARCFGQPILNSRPTTKNYVDTPMNPKKTLIVKGPSTGPYSTTDNMCRPASEELSLPPDAEDAPRLHGLSHTPMNPETFLDKWNIQCGLDQWRIPMKNGSFGLSLRQWFFVTFKNFKTYMELAIAKRVGIRRGKQLEEKFEHVKTMPEGITVEDSL